MMLNHSYFQMAPKRVNFISGIGEMREKKHLNWHHFFHSSVSLRAIIKIMKRLIGEWEAKLR